MVSVSDLPRSEANARWKRPMLSLMRYARPRSCCLRNWIDLVLPVLKAFFRPSRIYEAVVKATRGVYVNDDIRRGSDRRVLSCKGGYSPLQTRVAIYSSLHLTHVLLWSACMSNVGYLCLAPRGFVLIADSGGCLRGILTTPHLVTRHLGLWLPTHTDAGIAAKHLT